MIVKSRKMTEDELLRALAHWVAGDGKSTNIAERWKKLKGISGKISSSGGDFIITITLAGVAFSIPVKKS